MKNKTRALLLILLCTFVNAFAQVFLKLGVKNFVFDIFLIITNYSLLTGLFLYGLSSLLFIYALKNGDLSVLTPLFSLTYVWVNILSVYLLAEAIRPKQGAGIASILIGVWIIAKGEKK